MTRNRAGGRTRRGLLAVVLLLVGAGAALTILPMARAELTFPETPLTIVTPETRHVFTVEVARSPEQRARGLMYRSEMPVDRGMLFDFGRVQPVSMWMRNTLLPLDMLFIDEEGVIRKIATDTEPLSLETIASGEPVLAVLELNAGTTRLLGIETGDLVVHPVFGNHADD